MAIQKIFLFSLSWSHIHVLSTVDQLTRWLSRAFASGKNKRSGFLHCYSSWRIKMHWQPLAKQIISDNCCLIIDLGFLGYRERWQMEGCLSAAFQFPPIKQLFSHPHEIEAEKWTERCGGKGANLKTYYTSTTNRCLTTSWDQLPPKVFKSRIQTKSSIFFFGFFFSFDGSIYFSMIYGCSLMFELSWCKLLCHAMCKCVELLCFGFYDLC